VAARTFHRYARSQDVPNTAVRLILRVIEDSVVADVEWPANAETGGGNYLYPTYVPLAIERAEDVRAHYGFIEVAVVTGNPDFWNEAWGRLV